MGALRCEDTGSLEGTALRQIPDPVVAGPGQVVVDVKAASVDFVDTLIAVGRDQIPIPVPSTPGNNLAGVVREVGPGCNRLAVWDLEFCRKTGADEAVSYSEPRFKEALKELTGGGADVVPDMVGGECSEPALRAIADFERRRPEQAAVNRDALERMLADGRITPPITGRYRLEQAAEAMRVVAGRDKFGITILEMT